MTPQDYLAAKDAAWQQYLAASSKEWREAVGRTLHVPGERRKRTSEAQWRAFGAVERPARDAYQATLAGLRAQVDPQELADYLERLAEPEPVESGIPAAGDAAWFGPAEVA